MDTLQQSPPAEPEGGLRRNLKKRHLLMMSLGGTIGTGLFIGIAEPLSSVGPAGTLLAYLFCRNHYAGDDDVSWRIIMRLSSFRFISTLRADVYAVTLLELYHWLALLV